MVSNTGNVYYTTDGSDPRLTAGSVSSPQVVQVLLLILLSWRLPPRMALSGRRHRSRHSFGQLPSLMILNGVSEKLRLVSVLSMAGGEPINPGRHLTVYCNKSILLRPTVSLCLNPNHVRWGRRSLY